MVYMILSNGKKLEVKLIGDLVFIKDGLSKWKRFPWDKDGYCSCELWSYKGKLSDFDKGFSINGYHVLFDF
ncbi:MULTISPECIES: hypothetical protein [unclassified Synechocystis]|uniref:hypothetical protein n=1 Tax=unclassified Synechocystis TaxID=2640012 RepID=UPI000427D848|nr:MULTISPECIES: hypothetical protein [unclassified Synechocystis]AIE73833.1 hypothetical protein D082_13050 [Synechocystis sp. PCC 6714]MCT0252351.1 hypothetical protein [Synechocystis sp. CS-94]